MVAAWLITLPCAGVVGAVMWWIGHALGGMAGALAIFALLLAAAGAMYVRSHREPVDHRNVNDDWDATPTRSGVPAAAAR